MKRSKMFVLALILGAGLLTVSVGTTYARYRDEQQGTATFLVREPAEMLLGTVVDGEFSSTVTPEWTVTNGVASLQLAVANGSSEARIIRLYMIGSLGISKDGNTPQVAVTYFPQDGSGEVKNVTAYATSIEKNTALYHTYGEGWKYGFYELTTDGTWKELTWEVPGDMNYVTMTVTTNVGNNDSVSLWYPLIAVDPLSN